MKNNPDMKTIGQIVPRNRIFRSMVLVGAAIFSVSSFATAATHTLPVALSFPADQTKFDKSLIDLFKRLVGNDMSFQLDQDLGDLQIHDPMDVTVSGLRIKGDVDTRIDQGGNDLVIEAKLRNLQLQIKNIAIHSEVTTTIGNVTARIRIDADCRDVQVQWPGRELPLFARGRVSVQDQLRLNLSGLVLPIPDSQPETTAACTGPIGVETILQEQVWASLQERWRSPEFQADLQRRIEEAFNRVFRSSGEALPLYRDASLSIGFVQETWSRSADQSSRHVLGHLRIETAMPMKAVAPAPITAAMIPKAVSGPTLTMSVRAIESLVQIVAPARQWTAWIDAQGVSGFRKLMRSRFMQFFVFPDLMRYPKNAPFWFAMSLTGPTTTRCESGDRLAVKAPLGAWLGVRNGETKPVGFKPMVFFWLPAQASLSLPKSSGQRKMNLNIEHVSLRSEFDRSYLEREQPNTSIADSMIEDEVRSVAGDLVLQDMPGAIGSVVRALDQFDVSCNSVHQKVDVRLSEPPSLPSKGPIADSGGAEKIVQSKARARESLRSQAAEAR